MLSPNDLYMKTLSFLSLFLVSSVLAFGQNKQDTELIKAMCGCYEVSFQYAETFSPSAKYEFHDRYTASALEWVGLVEESSEKLSLQHILVLHDTMALKHWRQDWIFENQDLYTFQGDHVWNYETLPADDVPGQWTQKVYQVDDGPRYEGRATWIHADGKHYWETTVNAPLPRREYTHRNDYTILERTNRHEITEEGHIHDQDNAKINRVQDKTRVIAYEKGINTYQKVDDERCKAAASWWQENQAFWADVRTVWDEIFERQQTLHLRDKVNEQRLYEVLFPLNDELMANGNYDSATGLPRIREAIEQFVVIDTDVAAGQ